MSQESRVYDSDQTDLDTVLGMIAHEVKSPLQAILWSADALESLEIENKLLKERLTIIKRQAELLNHIFDSIYLYSGIQHNKLLHEIELVRVSDLVDQAIESCRLFSEKKGIYFVRECSLSGSIECIPTIIVQVIINIISNAIKFSPEQCEIKIWISADPRSTRVHILDKGAGMESEQLQSIFKLFNQAGARGGDGLGIGLYLSGLFVRLHNGMIQVNSDGRGHGSEFIIELPNSISPEIAFESL